MQVQEIRAFLEAQKTNVDASLAAINTLSEHIDKQSKEIVKLNEQLKKQNEDK